MPLTGGVAESVKLRVIITKDLPSIIGLGPFKAGSAAALPASVALRLVDMGAAQLDETELLKPQDVQSFKYSEEKDQWPIQLPEDFYARAKASILQLKREGDSRTMGQLISATRDLLIKRVEKIARLLAASPDLVENNDFMARLTPEERALARAIDLELISLLREVL
ncbi:replication initiation protein [Thermoproteus tenax]|uniref:Replication initiation protein, GINS family n=1 Tax=Thermoproteus tenax (strain ATCC 35583 / DSM 2078 / JCM 9277 / NBRC 100435 / Kra 1) TaxID=768679 RepID=G4RNQ4_THETK|nr:replication initiation protein [Thermoproteus tenax]CCC81198.1 replication initiation protein, GINS family [Thermoproteus tenax Kra 1]